MLRVAATARAPDLVTTRRVSGAGTARGSGADGMDGINLPSPYYAMSLPIVSVAEAADVPTMGAIHQ